MYVAFAVCSAIKDKSKNYTKLLPIESGRVCVFVFIFWDVFPAKPEKEATEKPVQYTTLDTQQAREYVC